ncbi:Hsp70 family protein, partial [Bartonella taylorii]|uniref:Hsp70 family protein n=2 Tax=Bartonella TaxID=773 RepID=UPI001ABACE5D
EALVHSTEKSLAEYGDKVSPEDKGQIETAMADLKTALEGTDTEEVTVKMQKLAEVSMKLGQAMYEASETEAKTDTETDTKNDDVVDADFEEVNDQKK